MIKRKLKLTLVAIASFQWTPAIADDNSQSTDQEKRLVVIAERQAQPASQVNGSVTAVDEALSLIQPNHLNELSTEVPGLWISKGNGQEHLTAIRSPVFTGPGSCAEFLMLQNGVSLRAKGFCNVNQLFDSFFEQATQVEVFRGTHSAFYGSDAVHGVINVNTKELDRVLEPRHSVKLKLGDFGFLRADIESVFDEQAFKFTSSKDQGVKRNSGFDQQKLQYELLNNASNFSIHTVLTANNLNQETAGYLQMGESAYRNSSSLYVNEFPEAFRDAQSFRLQSTVKPKSKDNWSLTPYLRYTDMSFLMHFLPGQPVENNGHYSLGANADFRFGEEEFFWRYGIDVELTRGYLEQAQSAATDSGIDFLDEVLPIGKHYDFEVDSAYLGSFIATDWRIDGASKLSAGMRFDYVRYDYNNRMLTGRTRADGSACGFGGCRYTRPADRSDDFSQPSVFVSYGYRISNGLKYYVKWDKGFRAPQVTELYRLQNGQTTAELEPQEVTSFEAGLRFHGDNLLTSFAVFNMNKSNVIYQNTERAWVYNATTEHQGIEWSANYAFDEHWYFNAQWIWAKHNYTSNSQLTSENIDGNDMDTAPRHMGALSVLWSPVAQWELRTSIRNMGGYYLNPENTERYPGHTAVSFDAAWQLSSQTRLILNIRNLTDQRYADRADYAFGQHRYFVAEPRRVFLGVELQLN